MKLTEIAMRFKKAYLRSAGNAFWAVADQFLFAVSNFSINILLARWLPVEDYGAFAVVFAVFLLIGTFHTGVLTEPMLVFGADKYSERFQSYLGTLLYAHAGFGALICILFLGAALVAEMLGSRYTATVGVAFAFAGPCILLLWLVRRACYVTGSPKMAAYGGGVYVAIMLSGACLLSITGLVSAVSVVVVMGASSLLVGLWLCAKLGICLPTSGDPIVKKAMWDHWHYGRWSVVTQAMAWAPMHIYYLVLPIWGGLGAAASLRALMNLVLPAQQGIMALATNLLPSLTRVKDTHHFESLVRQALAAFVAGAVVYWLLLSVFRGSVLELFYGNRYSEATNLVFVLALLPISISVVQVFATALRSRELPRLVFKAYVVSSSLSLAVGLVLTSFWGTFGAALGMLTYSVITASATFYLYRRFVLEQRRSSVRSG